MRSRRWRTRATPSCIGTNPRQWQPSSTSTGSLGAAGQDGQHGEFSFVEATSADGQSSPVLVVDILPVAFSPRSRLLFGATDHRQMRGRWFFRSHVERPPRTLDELRANLTENQVARLDRDLRDRPWLMYGLVWRNAAGLVCTMVARTNPTSSSGDHVLVALQPKGREAMLRRAGPDAAVLQSKAIAIVGVGAVGSHVAAILARSGIAKIVLLDFDRSWPVNLVRHAAPPGTPAAEFKTHAMKRHLEQYPWVEVVVPENGLVFDLEQIRELVTAVDLTVDATGHGGFAEVIARVAHQHHRPYLSVALFQGGGIARVRRQVARTDTPLLIRPRVDGYPTIPALTEEIEYVGTETGCLAQVHNSPPAAVITAAALASQIAIDALTERLLEPDEVIEVLRPSAPPFTTIGRLRPSELPVTIDITESAIESATTTARSALPNETGGVLVGCDIDGRTVVTHALEIPDPTASPTNYTVPAGAAEPAVQAATTDDDRLGYLGEWHSHPSGGPPSVTDRATMMELQDTSGTGSPVLLLVDPSVESARLAAHVAAGDRLVPAEVVATGEIQPVATGQSIASDATQSTSTATERK